MGERIFAHNVKISVFAYEEENANRIKSTLISLCPFNLEEQKVTVGETVALGATDKKIIIYEIYFDKQRNIRKFVQNLHDRLSADEQELLRGQRSSRLDEEMNFFIRLDKEKLMNGELNITDGGKCFHIRLTIAAYPKSRDVALDSIKTWLC
jgi:RNA binding exosome subunit